MSHRILVVGFIDIDDDEYDEGPLGPLTAKAFDAYSEMPIRSLEDLEYELVEDV